MKHIGADGLDRLEDLLVELRRIETLREKKRGVFYRESRAFLHFHDDPSGLFADVRLASEFERMRVTTKAEQRVLLAKISATLESV